MKRPILLVNRSLASVERWKTLLERKGYTEVKVFDDPTGAIKFLVGLQESERKKWLETGFFSVGFLFGLSKPEGRVLVEKLKEYGVPIQNIARSSVMQRGPHEINGHPFIQIPIGEAEQMVSLIVRLAEGS